MALRIVKKNDAQFENLENGFMKSVHSSVMSENWTKFEVVIYF